MFTIIICAMVASLGAGYLLGKMRRRNDDGSPVAPGTILLRPTARAALLNTCSVDWREAGG